MLGFLKSKSPKPHKASTFCTCCYADKGERHEPWCHLGKSPDTRTKDWHKPGFTGQSNNLAQ